MDIKKYDNFYRSIGQSITKDSTSIYFILHIQNDFDSTPIFRMTGMQITEWLDSYSSTGEDPLFGNDLFLTNHHDKMFAIAAEDATIEGGGLKELISSDISVGSIREYANFDTGKYSISNVTIKISDYDLQGKRYNNQKGLKFSDYLIDYINKTTMINKPVTLYYVTSNCTQIWRDCPPVYYGYIRDFSFTNDKITLKLEDLSEQKFHKDIPIQTVSSTYGSNAAFKIPERFVNTPIPMIYGHIPSARIPFVIEDTVHGYQKTKFLIDRIEQAQLGGSWWEDENESGEFESIPNMYPYLWTYLQVRSDSQYASIFPEADYTYPPDLDGFEYAPSYEGKQYDLDQSSNHIEFFMPSKSEAAFMPDGEESEWFWDRNTFYNQIDCLMIRKAKSVSYNNNLIDIRGVKPSTVDPDFVTTYDGDGEFNIFVDENNLMELGTSGNSYNIIKPDGSRFSVFGDANSSPLMGTTSIIERDPSEIFEGQESTGAHDSYEWKTQVNDVHLSIDFEDAGSWDWSNGVTTLIGMFEHHIDTQETTIAGHCYNHAAGWLSKQSVLNAMPLNLCNISGITSFSGHGRDMNLSTISDLAEANPDYQMGVKGRFGLPEYFGGPDFGVHNWSTGSTETGLVTNKKFEVPPWRIDSNFLHIQCVRDSQAISGLSLDDLLNPEADGFSALAEGVINQAQSTYSYANFYSSFQTTPTGSHYVPDNEKVYYRKDMDIEITGTEPSDIEGHTRWWQMYTGDDSRKKYSAPFTTLCSGAVNKGAQYVLDAEYPHESMVKNLLSPYNYWWDNTGEDGTIGGTDITSTIEYWNVAYFGLAFSDSGTSTSENNATIAYDSGTQLAIEDEKLNNDYGNKFNNMFKNVLWHDFDSDGVNDNCQDSTGFWQSAIFNMLHPSDVDIASLCLSNLNLFYDNQTWGNADDIVGEIIPESYPNSNWTLSDSFGNYNDLVSILDWRAPSDYNAIKLSWGPLYAPMAAGGYFNNGLTKWMQPGFRPIDVLQPFEGTSYGRLDITYLGVAHRCLLYMPLVEQDYYMNTYGRVGTAETTQSQHYNFFIDSYKLQPQNPVDVLHHIMVEELGYSPDKVNLESKENAFIQHAGWKLEFALTKIENSKKVIEDICKSFKTIARIDYNGDLNFVTLNEYYTNIQEEEIARFKWINTFEIIKSTKKLTPLQDIKTKVKVLFAYDEDTDLYNQDTGYCYADYTLDDDGENIGYGSGTEGYNLSYYSLPIEDLNGNTHPDSTLEFKTKYIQDRYTAKELRNFLMYQKCNQHVILKLTLPISYFHIEVGEILKLSKQLKRGQDTLAVGSSNFQVELDSYKKNGQWIYPGYLVTSINRKTDIIEIEAMQLHQLDNSGSTRWVGENPDLWVYGCQDPAAVNYDPNATHPTVCYFLGDIDNNGTIDPGDVTLLSNWLAGNIDLSPAQILAGDVTQNGVTDLDDLAFLEDIVAGELPINPPPDFLMTHIGNDAGDDVYLSFYDVVHIGLFFYSEPEFTTYELLGRCPQFSDDWVVLKSIDIGEHADYANIDFSYNEENFSESGNNFDPYNYGSMTSPNPDYDIYWRGDIVLGQNLFQELIPDIDWTNSSYDGYYLGSYGTVVELKIRGTNINIINENFLDLYIEWFGEDGIEEEIQMFETGITMNVNSGVYLTDPDEWWNESGPDGWQYSPSDIMWFGNFQQMYQHNGYGYIDCVVISEQTVAYTYTDNFIGMLAPWANMDNRSKLPWSLFQEPSYPDWSDFNGSNSNSWDATTYDYDYAQRCYDLNIGIHAQYTGFGVDWETNDFSNEDFYSDLFFNNDIGGAPIRHRMCGHAADTTMSGEEANEQVEIDLMLYQDAQANNGTDWFDTSLRMMKNCKIYPLVRSNNNDGDGVTDINGTFPLGEYGLYTNLDEPAKGWPMTTEQDPLNPRMHPNAPRNYPDNWINYAPPGNHDITDGSRRHVKDLWNITDQNTIQNRDNSFMYTNTDEGPAGATNFYTFRIYGELDDLGGGTAAVWDLWNDTGGPMGVYQTDFGGLYDDAWGNNTWQYVMPYLTYGWPFTLRVTQRYMDGNSESQDVEELTVRVIRSGSMSSGAYNNFNEAEGLGEFWGNAPSGYSMSLPAHSSWLQDIWRGEADPPDPYPDPPDPPEPEPYVFVFD